MSETGSSTENSTDDLVLRSFYISRWLDEALRVLAFERQRSKADLMRELLEDGVGALDVPAPMETNSTSEAQSSTSDAEEPATPS